MTIKPTNVVAVLVDDQESDRQRYSELLSSDDLAVVPIAPADQMETVDAIEETCPSDTPSVVILDYRLDEAPSVRYRGGSLAAAIRDRVADIPLVLLTTEVKLEGLEHRAGVEDLFDWRLLKARVPKDRARTRERLVDLATTYWRLCCDENLLAASGWDRVSIAMRCERSELEDVARRETFDPSDQSPAQLGRWMLTRLIRHQGLLLDTAQARAVTGLTRESFVDPKLQKLINVCRYDGVLSQFGERLWADRLRQVIADAVGGYGPAESAVRADGLSTAAGAALDAAGCVWCGSGRVLRACSCCREPVDASHAIARLTEPLPGWADRPVVCFRCIADGKVPAAQLASGSEQIVDDLASGDLASPLEEIAGQE